MTVEEALALGERGDIEAIRALGHYYFEGGEGEDRDTDESLKWYERGGNLGDELCMILASSIYSMHGYAKRMIAGSSGAKDFIEDAKAALSWASKARDRGHPSGEARVKESCADLGIAYYFLGLDEVKKNSILGKEHFGEAIQWLMGSARKTKTKNSLLYLAFALRQYRDVEKTVKKKSETDELIHAAVGNAKERVELEQSLLVECVDNYFDEIENANCAAYYAGVNYMEGVGCKKNYDKAVFYFQKAHDAGLDCSSMLGMFKKTLFGYKLKS